MESLGNALDSENLESMDQHDFFSHIEKSHQRSINQEDIDFYRPVSQKHVLDQSNKLLKKKCTNVKKQKLDKPE